MTSNSITNAVAKIEARLQLTNADANEDDEKIAKENERTKQSHFLKTLCDLELDF